MDTRNLQPIPAGETAETTPSRRQTLALMLGAGGWLAGNLAAADGRRQTLALMLGAGGWLAGNLAAADGSAPVHLAISETVVGEVNLNDARAAMLVWTKRLTEDLNVVIDPKLFNSTQEIVDRTRKGQLDAMAVNVIEYRQIADLLDSSQIIGAAGAAGLEQYLILVKQNSGIRQIGDLKGRRLCTLKNPRMCVAPAWIDRKSTRLNS